MTLRLTGLSAIVVAGAATAAAIGLAAGGVLPAAAAPGNGASKSGALAGGHAVAGRQRIYIAAEGCSGHAYKPSKVILACADANLYVTGLKYSSYGRANASAAGTIHANDCTPDCAGGHFHKYPGSVRFFDIVKCSDGRSYYSKAKYHFSGPYGSGTADVAPLTLRCKAGS